MRKAAILDFEAGVVRFFWFPKNKSNIQTSGSIPVAISNCELGNSDFQLQVEPNITTTRPVQIVLKCVSNYPCVGPLPGLPGPHAEMFSRTLFFFLLFFFFSIYLPISLGEKRSRGHVLRVFKNKLNVLALQEHLPVAQPSLVAPGRSSCCWILTNSWPITEVRYSSILSNVYIFMKLVSSCDVGWCMHIYIFI